MQNSSTQAAKNWLPFVTSRQELIFCATYIYAPPTLHKPFLSLGKEDKFLDHEKRKVFSCIYSTKPDPDAFIAPILIETKPP